MDIFKDCIWPRTRSGTSERTVGAPEAHPWGPGRWRLFLQSSGLAGVQRGLHGFWLPYHSRWQSYFLRTLTLQLRGWPRGLGTLYEHPCSLPPPPIRHNYQDSLEDNRPTCWCCVCCCSHQGELPPSSFCSVSVWDCKHPPTNRILAF